MEILNSGAKKRTLLLVYDSEEMLDALRGILEQEYKLILVEHDDRDFSRVLEESVDAISAAVISAAEAARDDFALFRWISESSTAEAVPLLVYCGGEADRPYVGGCLERGAVDVLIPPLLPEVALNRIRNAIRLKDSATFLEIERMLNKLPSLIYLKDAEGRYVFSTHYWHHLEHGDDPDWTIRGKTDVEIRKDKENAIKAMESDREIIRTGKGTDYVIEVNADGMREFLEIIKEPVYDKHSRINGIIALINNVTESQLMRLSFEEKAMKDELTGADNRRCFEQFAAGLESSCQLPVSIISADCDDLKYINDTYGHLVGDEYIRMAVLLFKMVLPKDSYVFRTGGDEFVLVLPNSDEQAAAGYIRRMKDEEQHFRIKDRTISISYGASCIRNENQTLHGCLDVADKRMYENKREHKRTSVR